MNAPAVAGGLLVAAALCFLFAPMAVVVLFSFHDAASLTLPFEGFSLRWWEEVVGDAEFRDAFANSLAVALAVSLSAAVLSAIAAYALLRARTRTARAMDVMICAALTVPPLMLGVGLLATLHRLEIDNSLVTVSLAHLVFVLPLVYLFARLAVSRLDRGLEEAAADLGASSAQTFRLAVLPQILPAVASASVIAFMLSMDEFLITNFVIGSDPTVPIFLFGRIGRSIEPTINVISSMFVFGTLLAVAGAVTIMLLASRRRGRAATTALEELT